MPQPVDEPVLQHLAATPGVPAQHVIGPAVRRAPGVGAAAADRVVADGRRPVREPLVGDAVPVQRPHHGVRATLHDDRGRQRGRAGLGRGNLRPRRHRGERLCRPGRRAVRRGGVHPDGGEDVRVGRGDRQCHGSPGGQPGHVDAALVHAPPELLRGDLRDDPGDDRGLPRPALLVRGLVPAPAPLRVVAGLLVGQHEQEAVAVGGRGEARRVGELGGCLAAAVQQHDQRRRRAPAQPGGDVHVVGAPARGTDVGTGHPASGHGRPGGLPRGRRPHGGGPAPQVRQQRA